MIRQEVVRTYRYGFSSITTEYLTRLLDNGYTVVGSPVPMYRNGEVYAYEYIVQIETEKQNDTGND